MNQAKPKRSKAPFPEVIINNKAIKKFEINDKKKDEKKTGGKRSK